MINDLHDFDKKYSGIVVGVDEAGRGPLAGPVVAAAVRVNNPEPLFDINDSKKLTEKKREKLFDIIQENCDVAVGIADHKEVDKINILNATFKAMKDAVDQFEFAHDIVLVDGNKLIKHLDKKQEFVIKGDAKSLAIASASIIAKVTRDRIMKKMAEKYPVYSFEKHKGYGTKFHREMLLEHGPCEIHRETFLKKILGDKNDGKLF